MLLKTPIKLCGVLLLCMASLATSVIAFSFFGMSTSKKSSPDNDHRLARRHYLDDDGHDEHILGAYGGDDAYRDTQEDDDEEYQKRQRKKGRGVLYKNNKRIATEYTTVTGSCVPADIGQHYYTEFNDLQHYFEMGVYGRAGQAVAAGVGNALGVGGAIPLNVAVLAATPTCDPDATWAAVRNHWNAIFFGDFTVGGYQQTLGPLAVRGNFRGHDYVISTNNVFQCSTDVQLSNTAFVVGGTVTGQVVISRGMSYVGNLAGSSPVQGTCTPAREGPGPVDWPAYYNYWTNLSEALSQLMPTHVIDNNNNLRAVAPGTTHTINVFTFNTCNAFNCHLWPGLLSTPDNIFSGYGTWNGPIGRYPNSGTILLNIPVDDGTTFNIDSIRPTANADYCRIIINVYPADSDGRYVPGGHITIRRNTVDMLRGLFIAPLADIQDGPTGRFGGMVVGDNYSWQQTNGVEIDNWSAAANGAYYCNRYTGCVIPPTPDIDEGGGGGGGDGGGTPDVLITCPVCPEPSTLTDCQTTLSQCTATACTETSTLVPESVTLTTTGDCLFTPPVTLTNTQTITEFQVSTASDCTSTITDQIPSPATTVTVIHNNNIPGPTSTLTIIEREEVVVPGLTETITIIEREGITIPPQTVTSTIVVDSDVIVPTQTVTVVEREEVVIPGLTETITIVEREGIIIPPETVTSTIIIETDVIIPTAPTVTETRTATATATITDTIVNCPPGPDPDCTITDEFCLDTVTTLEPAFCTDYATVTTSITCTDTATDPYPGLCTDTETHCYPTRTRPHCQSTHTVTNIQTHTVTYVPGCDDYRYPNCDFEEEEENGGGNGRDEYDYFKRKKYQHKKKNNWWHKKKKMDEHDEHDDNDDDDYDE